MHTIFLLAAFTVLTSLADPATASSPMSVQFESLPGLPEILDAQVIIYLDGEITPDTPSRFNKVLDSLPPGAINIKFNSPGGNLAAAMEIGRLIRKYGASTSVGAQGEKEFSALPGKCLSACTLAYLGGAYRYWIEGSIFGVHRASLSKSSNGRDLDVGQILSAMIGNYIREMNADPGLLDLAVSAGANQMYVLSQAELKILKIVNNGRLPALWTIEAVPGSSYLKGTQETVYGRGKAIFSCIDGKFIFFSVYEAGGKSEKIAAGNWTHSLLLDGKNLYFTGPKNIMADGDFIISTFLLTRSQFQKIATAKSVGHAMQQSKQAPTFVGYEVDIEKNTADRVRNFINNCLLQSKIKN